MLRDLSTAGSVGLSDVPDALLTCTSLTVLSLSSNNLTSLPSGLGVSLRLLASLDVSSNALDAVPDGLLACTSLTVLNLASNNLTSLPSSLGVSLHTLNLAREWSVMCECGAGDAGGGDERGRGLLACGGW